VTVRQYSQRKRTHNDFRRADLENYSHKNRTAPAGDIEVAKQLDHRLGRKETLPTPPEGEYNYWAEAIKHGDTVSYRVNGSTVEITEE